MLRGGQLRLVSEKRRSLPDSGITLVQVADVPGLFDNGTVNVPQALQDRFPNWVSELRKRQISGDFDLRDGAASIDAALAALCRAGRDDAGSRESASAAQEDGSSPDDDEKNDADVADDSSQTSENYEKAVEKIEELFEENPDEIDRARILNAYYMEMGGWAEAEGELEDAKEYYEKRWEQTLISSPFSPTIPRRGTTRIASSLAPYGKRKAIACRRENYETALKIAIKIVAENSDVPKHGAIPAPPIVN